jgi:hypothetical protein
VPRARQRTAWILLLSVLLAGQAGAAEWSLYVAGGSSYSLPTRLVIRQKGQTDITLTAHYRTRPLFEVPYYDVRLSRDQWELELIHQKLYLENRPPEVDTFEITHGYNFITLNRVFCRRGLDLRGGAGIVLAHPETMVRGLWFDDTQGILRTGWYVSGVAAQVGLGRSFRLGRHWFVGVEGKATAAWARVLIAQGTADVPNLALHLQVGAGYRF